LPDFLTLTEAWEDILKPLLFGGAALSKQTGILHALYAIAVTPGNS
jgi:hypothetical protein